MKNIVKDFDWYFLENDKAVLNNIDFAQKYNKVHPMESRSTKQIFIALSHCKNFRRAIDVGAHYGTSSFHFSNNFRNVEAFEIDPQIRECLQMNVNNFSKKNVTIYPYGCGRESKHINLSRNVDSHFTKIDLKSNNLTEENSDSKIIALDNYDWQDVDFIKIDTEGSELHVLKGAKQTIELYSPLIEIEVNGLSERIYNIHENEMFTYLKEMKYSLFANKGANLFFYRT